MSAADTDNAPDARPPARAHESAPPDKDSPEYRYQVLRAREADLARARENAEAARETAGASAMDTGTPDPRLLAEAVKAAELVLSLEKTVRQAVEKLAEAETLQKRRQAEAINEQGKQHGGEYLAASVRLQSAIEAMAAEYIEVFRAGSLLTRTLTQARQLVPPDKRNDGRVMAGDARDAIAVADYLVDRVQVEITRRLGPQLWSACPDRPPGVMNCPLADQHEGIVHNALIELAATLGLEP